MTAADDDVPITRELCRSVLPTGSAAIAFALAFLGCVQCNVIKFTSTSGLDEPITIQFGFWTHEDLELYSYQDSSTSGTYIVKSCTHYGDDVDIDQTWKASAAFSILPLIIGGIEFLWMAMQRCKAEHWFDCIAYLLAFFFQGLSLLFLDSNACKNNTIIRDISYNSFRSEITFPDTCSISTGANLIIASMVFWALAAFASADSCMAKKKKEDAALTEPLIEDTL